MSSNQFLQNQMGQEPEFERLLYVLQWWSVAVVYVQLSNED